MAESLYINPSENRASFVFNTSGSEVTNSESEAIARRSSELTILLARYMNLYRFLDLEGLVLFYKPALRESQSVFIGKADARKTLSYAPIYDDTLRDLAWKYHHSYSIPSPALKEIVSHNFIDDEDRKFTKSLRSSWVAIWISLALGLAGIVMNITNNIDQDRKFSKQIESSTRSAEDLTKSIKQLPAEFLKLLSETSKQSLTR
ncbi:MAG: hypothetical protein WD037_05825 [Balneolales bacterium]